MHAFHPALRQGALHIGNVTRRAIKFSNDAATTVQTNAASAEVKLASATFFNVIVLDAS